MNLKFYAKILGVVLLMAVMSCTKVADLGGDSGSEAALKSLSMQGAFLNEVFSSGLLSYSAETAYASVAPEITAVKKDSQSFLEWRINGGNFAISADGRFHPQLDVGMNHIEIRLVSVNQKNIQTYTLTVVRRGGADNALLRPQGIVLSSGSLSPAFDSEVFSYTAGVSNQTESFSFTPHVLGEGATVQVQINGGGFNPVNSGSSTGNLPLNEGENTVLVKVTSADGNTTQTYTITVHRIALKLDSLTVSEGSLNPVFSFEETAYTVLVANSVSSVTLTPATPAGNGIELRINGGAYQTVVSGSASASLPLNVGNNTVEIKVTVPDGSVLIYTLIIYRPFSSPQNLSAVESVWGDSVYLSWTSVAGAGSYEVFRSETAGGSYTLIGTSIANSFEVTDLSPANYYYKVRAKAEDTLSEFSSAVQGITLDPALLKVRKVYLMPLSPANYTDHGNGTVTDNATGLIWQKCSAGQSGVACATGSAGTYTWSNAKTYCDNLTLGGRSDWRLPEINELLTLTDLSRVSPAINVGVFPATVSDVYWSNTVYAGSATYSWLVNFNSGNSYYLIQTNTYRVRCVAP